MENKTEEMPVYTPPVVLDAGEVAEVTLGKNTFDRVDRTQYKDK